MYCRLMKEDDIDRVYEIERDSFSDPWSKNSFKQEMKNNIARYIVCVDGDSIVGYIGSWFIIDEAHINNVAISPEFRKKGYGDFLIQSFLDFCRENLIVSVTLEVRKSNFIAQNLYKKHGFLPAGIRKEYYSDNREDAVIMWKQLEVKK